MFTEATAPGVDRPRPMAPCSEGPEPSKPVLVLGLGNGILCDDSIGLRVVRAVRRRLAPTAPVECLETEEMGLALLDFLVGRRDVVLVDAVQTGQIPVGQVQVIEGSELPALSQGSPHFLGVGETLALGNALGFPMPQRVRIVAVEVQDPFQLSLQMSPAVEAAFPGVVDRVLAVVRDLAGA